MRVAIYYSDGLYYLYDPTERKFANGIDPVQWMAANTIEISEALWQEYKAHMDVVRTWQERIAILDQREQA